ncbi:PQQ-dependent catabolism-associated beta-propeller protein [Anaerohalosphaera lusitana]|uniref:PQQ-dependent catabolism-associated beta-propeller protein n=1 Tax=Anaerohalosphaera lusitana TaxID=1936003 RepID=A0A1U9NRS5_9BACT|nr:c-type cytochrome [Anaerohalosphaera lusitana]AQT70310.1 PQQ-dependent catabolism-associated beta-propeller protein [Anaerohalosphaera lusitana]
MRSIFVIVLVFAAAVSGSAAEYSAPSDVVDGPGGKIYVNESAAGRIAVIGAELLEVERQIDIGSECGGFAVSADGKYLYAAVGGVDGKLLKIDAGSGEIVGSVRVGHTPGAVEVSADGGTVFVCNRFSDDVSVIDAGRMKERARVVVAREPVAVAVSRDGKYLFVANLLPAGAADEEHVAACVSVVDVKRGLVCENIALPNGSVDLHGMCLSPDGEFVYVTHVLARFQLPTTQLQRGWMNTNAVSVIDVDERELVNTVLLDDVAAGAANPWGVDCSDDGKFLCVSHAGTGEVSVIYRQAMHERLSRAERGMKVTEVTSSADAVKNDMSFLRGIRRRIKLKGVGPRGVAVGGGKVFAAEYFSDSVAVVGLADGAAASVSLGEAGEMSLVRKGEMYFNDARLCFQGWQSCASCHPGEARTDALNWDLLNDGIGNPKNTKSLLASHETGAAMITGVRASAEVAVRAGIRHIQFAEVDEEKARAIDAYLKSLRPVASPRLVDGELSESAVRGKNIFETAGCGHCHSGEYFTDMKKHDVWTGEESVGELETPTLVELWRTAPYLFDGRAAELAEVFTEHNEGDRHGRTSGLSEQEVRDLVEYVLSL